MLKLTAAEDSLEEKRLTGTETSPKEIVAEAMDLAGMWGFYIPARVGPGKKAFQAGGSDVLARRWCDLGLTRLWFSAALPRSDVGGAAFHNSGLCASVSNH
jgi:hypothetical protein